MAKQSTGEDRFEGKTFQDLENRVKEILEKLGSESTSLDEQVSLGEEGSAILDEMERRLGALKSRVDGISKASGSED